MDQWQAKLTHLSGNFPTDTLSSSSSSSSSSNILEAVQFLSSGSLRIEPPENPGRSPLFNSNNLLMGDDQSSLSIALIGSDNPHSTFSVDADAQKEDLYSREAANSMALTVAAADSAQSLMMEVQHQSSKPPPLIPTLLSRAARESPNAGGEPRHRHLAPPNTIVASKESTLSRDGRERTGGSSRAATGPSSVQAGVSFPDRAHHHGDSSASIGRLATSGGGSSVLPAPSGFSHVPLSRNAVHLVKSLSCASAPRSGGLGLHSSYRPTWTGKVPATALPVICACRPHRSLCCGSSPLPSKNLLGSVPPPQPRRCRGPPLRRLPRPLSILMQ